MLGVNDAITSAKNKIKKDYKDNEIFINKYIFQV